jgi:hypothetical protein
MKYIMRRTAETRWKRLVMMRSLQLMMMNGVIRRAEVYPHRNLDKYVDLDADPETSLSSMPVITLDEQRGFARFPGRHLDSPFTHARQAT